MSETNYNAADEPGLTKRKRKDETIREQELADAREVMSTPAGRRFVWRILGQAGVFKSSFTGNSTTFFNEGRRDLGLWITSELMANPGLQEGYLTMQTEAMRKENTNG